MVGTDYTSDSRIDYVIGTFSPYDREAEIRARRLKATYELVQRLLREGNKAYDEMQAIFGDVIGLAHLSYLLMAEPCQQHPRMGEGWGHYYRNGNSCAFCSTGRPGDFPAEPPRA